MASFSGFFMMLVDGNTLSCRLKMLLAEILDHKLGIYWEVNTLSVRAIPD